MEMKENDMNYVLACPAMLSKCNLGKKNVGFKSVALFLVEAMPLLCSLVREDSAE
jgi:hypothetical protein